MKKMKLKTFREAWFITVGIFYQQYFSSFTQSFHTQIIQRNGPKYRKKLKLSD